MDPYIAVTVTASVVAALMSAIAWRVVREDRRRSEARIRTLAADIQRDDRGDADVEIRRTVPVSNDLFTVAERPRATGRATVAIALGGFAVVSAAALAVVLSAGTRTAPPAPVRPQPTVAHAPLELVALDHDRDGSGLTVRGVVRNPAGAAAVNRLAAVVSVFNREGGFVASASRAVDASMLGENSESSFIVSVPGLSDVGRYRVSFRTDDRVVPHVDRRSLEH